MGGERTIPFFGFCGKTPPRLLPSTLYAVKLLTHQDKPRRVIDTEVDTDVELD